MKATRKLIPALAMLLVSAVVMSTASYAWFTMSRQVTATGMNVTVTAPNNLLIKSTTGTSEDYSATGTAVLSNVVLYPASTNSGKADDIYLIKNGESVANDGKLAGATKLETANVFGASSVDASSIGYVDFKYTLKTDGDQAVNVFVKEIVLKNNGALPADVSHVAGQDDSETTYAWIEDDANHLTYKKTVQAYTADNQKSGDATETTETVTSVTPVRFAILAGDGSQTGITAANSLYNAGKGSNFDTKIVDSISDGAPTTGDVTYVTISGTAATDKAHTVFTVPAQNTFDITIRVWFEGQDTNCTVGKAAKANFSLSVVLADAANVK